MSTRTVTRHEAEVVWHGDKEDLRAQHVVLRPRVEFELEVDAETLDRLHTGAHERCFIANSVNCPVEVER